MSYSCSASFKKVESIDDLLAFFSKLKEVIGDQTVIDKIVEDNFYYCPLMRPYSSCYHETVDKSSAFNNCEFTYFIVKLFTFKWSYIENFSYAVLLGLPDELANICDGTVYFQNSTDQDYYINEYAGLQDFENIYKKWVSKPFEEAYKYLYNEDLSNSSEISDCEYVKRSAAYKEIAEPVKKLLYDDDSTVYISLLREYDNYSLINKYKRAFIKKIYKSSYPSDEE